MECTYITTTILQRNYAFFKYIHILKMFIANNIHYRVPERSRFWRQQIDMEIKKYINDISIIIN